MADITTNTLKIGSNNLILQDADAQAKITTLEADTNHLKEDILDIIDSAYVTDTASGAIASFPDGADNVPVKSLIVNVEPVQAEGVPSPDNILPISGHTKAVLTRTGKNLVNVQDKTITASDGEYWFYGLEIDPIPAGTYTISFKGTADPTTRYKFIGHDADGNELVAGGTTIPNKYTFTTNGTMKRIRMYVNSPGTYSDFQLELGSAATAYEPYQGQSVTVPLGQTVYGGTLNVNTGELAVTQELRTFGDLTWTMAGGGFYAEIPSSTPNNKTSICTAYEFNPSANAGSGTNMYATLSNGQYAWYTNQRRIFVKDTRFSDAASFKMAMADAKVTYGVADPVTVQLTANEISTVLGQNHIWADTGDTDVEYRADTKLYIEKLTAPTEDDMVADHAISANSFFMIGNTLYRATTAIASGATITVGTNATKLSLSDALNALS